MNKLSFKTRKQMATTSYNIIKQQEIKEDDDYFTCITKAFEILGNPVKRRSYDSVG